MRFETQPIFVPKENGLVEKLPDSRLLATKAPSETEILHRFWANAVKTTTLTAQRRFIDTFQLYTDSVVQQAADRDHSHIRSVDHYFELRRDTIGAKPSFAILEVKMDIPEKVMHDSSITTLTAACIDMLIIGNDLCSYNVESVVAEPLLTPMSY